MLLLFIFFKEKISLLGISIAGATASNVVQIELARLVLFGSAARFIAPPFLIAGLLTSILLGLFANRFVATSTWYKKHKELSL
jgi:heptaprenyl diphosphate synthase